MDSEFWWGNKGGKGPIGRPKCVGTITLEWNREAGWEGVEWIYLIWDKDKRRADVNTVRNLRIS